MNGDDDHRQHLESIDVLDDLFHACALAAFLDRAAVEGGSPDPESTRRLAYQLYESELARKHAAR